MFLGRSAPWSDGWFGGWGRGVAESSRSRSWSGGSRPRQKKRQATLPPASSFVLDERAKAAAFSHIHQGALPGVPVIRHQQPRRVPAARHRQSTSTVIDDQEGRKRKVASENGCRN